MGGVKEWSGIERSLGSVGQACAAGSSGRMTVGVILKEDQSEKRRAGGMQRTIFPGEAFPRDQQQKRRLMGVRSAEKDEENQPA